MLFNSKLTINCYINSKSGILNSVSDQVNQQRNKMIIDSISTWKERSLNYLNQRNSSSDIESIFSDCSGQSFHAREGSLCGSSAHWCSVAKKVCHHKDTRNIESMIANFYLLTFITNCTKIKIKLDFSSSTTKTYAINTNFVKSLTGKG